MALEKVWLKSYEPNIPAHIDYPLTVMPAVLEEMAHKFPHRAAMLFKGMRIDYQRLNGLVDRFAAALQKLGVVKGTRVAIHLPNCPQYVIAYYGILRSGGIVVPCNPLYQAHEMQHQLNDSGAEIIITLSALYPLIKRIRPATNLQHVIVAEIKTFFPPILKMLFTLAVEKKKGHRVSFKSDPNTYEFMAFMERAGKKPSPVALSWDDTAVLMYTGGTTGLSKGAQLTHKNILVNAYQCKAWLNSPEAENITLSQIPLFHCYGMTICMNMGILIASTMLLIPDPRDLEDVIRSIHQYRPTLYPGVPALYNAINNYQHLERYDLSSIRACISGAAGLPVEVQEKFQAITGANLVEGYGLSEASPVTHGNPVFGKNQIGTIGLPWPDTEVKIVDVDTGEVELGFGEIGEMCIHGPQVMKGYWNLPDETAAALRLDPADGRVWLYTGDIAVADEDGYFRVVDRKKDMILGAGGYNIYPREIEDTLYKHPKVLEAAAVGISMEGKGERIKVFVILKPDQIATQEEIIEFCRENLAPYKVPKIVEFRTELPKSNVGKILRRELLETEKRQTEPAELEVAEPEVVA